VEARSRQPGATDVVMTLARLIHGRTFELRALGSIYTCSLYQILFTVYSHYHVFTHYDVRNTRKRNTLQNTTKKVRDPRIYRRCRLEEETRLMSSVLKEVPARAPPARRPPSYGASAGRSPRPPPRGPPGPPPPKPPTASSTSAASPPPAMPRSGAATPGPPMSSGPPGSTPARPPVPGSANGRPPPKLSGTPGAPPPRPTGELGRLKAQLATANEAIAAADQRRKVEIDAMEQANNQLMLEVVDLKDELDETNEVIRAPSIIYTQPSLAPFLALTPTTPHSPIQS